MTLNTANQSLEDILNKAVKANAERGYFTVYPEHPKPYGEEAATNGLKAFQKSLNTNYETLKLEGKIKWVGEEVSPYLQTGIGLKYPSTSVDNYINNATKAWSDWKNTEAKKRSLILIDSLERIKKRFFELAHATMHTTGQSFMMSFQASGPHANDRALEALSLAYQELTRYKSEVEFVKPMGKFDLKVSKNFKAIPKGINLVIGCSTFPTWNTVPGLYAALSTGNPAIVKPHPKSILPIAIVVEEIQNAVETAGLNPMIVQLAPDTIENPVTKLLAEHPAVKMIDYTGGNAFGDYIESLGKTCFTEKAGINSSIIDSCKNIEKVVNNIAFSVSLYSGQMCTAPQNIYISNDGVTTEEGNVSFDEVVDMLKNGISGIVNHPKMGAGTLGAIQNETTIKNANLVKDDKNATLILDTIKIENPEFKDARIKSPMVFEIDAKNIDTYTKECFGPVVFVIKTDNFKHSLELMKNSAEKHGAITCLAFCNDDDKKVLIEKEMNSVFTPVSFNLRGAAFVNQHAAFSDFHVSGGNPAGNATFTDPKYVLNRFVWIGNRWM